MAIDGARRLTLSDAATLQELLVRCSDYYELHEGRTPSPDTAALELVNVPAGTSLDDKYTIGIFEDARLVAALDSVLHYAKPEEAWIGLLLVDPAHRSTGLGRRIVEAAHEWMAGEGIGVVYAAVSELNPRSERFWRARGYEERWRQEFPYDNGHVDRVMVLAATLPER